MADKFAQVRQYLLACPNIPADHPAIKAALSGLDAEQKRMERDAKLKMKFSNTAASNSGAASVMMQDVVTVEKPEEGDNENFVVEEKKSNSNMMDEDDNDWHDVSDENGPNLLRVEAGTAEDELAMNNRISVDESNPSTSNSYLGKRLAKEAIAAIGQFQVKVTTPLAAIAVAIHAALRSDVLEFVCTGVPESGPSSGFAPPMRELPKTQFLPNGWEGSSKTVVALRYRKKGLGALVLRVEEMPHSGANTDILVRVTLGPTSAATSSNPAAPEQTPLTFALSDYINLDSWTKAASAGAGVAPALHYKSLAVLMSNLASTIDLGAVAEDSAAVDESNSNELPYVDTTIRSKPGEQQQMYYKAFPVEQDLHKNRIVGEIEHWRRDLYVQDDPMMTAAMRIEERAFPGLRDARMAGIGGDFASDLAPGGVTRPEFFPAGGLPGTEMGPNHPLFQQQGRIQDGRPDFAGMKPRFDPYGPPPTRPSDDPNRDIRSTGSGNPNHDHFRPPSNSNMFS